jgi:hypothetical protein
VVEYCAIHWHSLAATRKLGAGSMKSMSYYTYQSVMLLFDLSQKAWIFGSLWQNGLKPYETASLREACPGRGRGSIGLAIPLLV